MKTILVANLLRLLAERAGVESLDRRKGITQLVKMGVVTGNAQRLLDDTTNVQLFTLSDVAQRLGCEVADLLAEHHSGGSVARLPARAPVAVDAALRVLLEHLARLTPVKWRAVSALLDAVVGHPEAVAEVSEELMPFLLHQAEQTERRA